MALQKINIRQYEALALAQQGYSLICMMENPEMKKKVSGEDEIKEPNAASVEESPAKDVVPPPILVNGKFTVHQAWPFDEAESQRRQKETAAGLGVPLETTLDFRNGVKLELVLIPAGRFMMGSPKSELKRSDKGEDLHEMTLTKPFWVGKYEVTEEQYALVTEKTPGQLKGSRKPVEKVSWDDAQNFCKKLSKLAGCEVRLLTEAEWEYACRAGTSTPFNTGETISADQANLRGDYPYGNAPKGKFRGETITVGSFRPNAFGFYDMHGNVEEWCGNGDYGEGIEPGSKIIRGGSWQHEGALCRSAFRQERDHYNHWVGMGFRVVVARAP